MVTVMRIFLGGARGVGLTLGRPGTLEPGGAGILPLPPQWTHQRRAHPSSCWGTHTQIGVPSQPWQWRSIFFRMIYLSNYSSVCMTPVSLQNLCLQVMEEHALAGRSFAFNSAGSTLIRNWKCAFVGCFLLYKNFHKGKKIYPVSVVVCHLKIFKYCCQHLLLVWKLIANLIFLSSQQTPVFWEEEEVSDLFFLLI